MERSIHFFGIVALLLLVVSAAFGGEFRNVVCEGYKDNVARCDGYKCKYTIETGVMPYSESLQSLSGVSSELTGIELRVLSGTFYYKIDGLTELVDSRVSAEANAVSTSKPLAKEALGNGRYSLVVTPDVLGCAQVFDGDRWLPGLLHSPWGLGVMGEGDRLSPSNVLSPVARGKFKVLEHQSGEYAFQIEYEAGANGGTGSVIKYFIDVEHGMLPRRVVIESGNAMVESSVDSFLKFKSGWFPGGFVSKVYSKTDAKTVHMTVMKVQSIEPITSLDDLVLRLPKGLAVNDDREDHVQVLVKDEIVVGLNDIESVYAIASRSKPVSSNSDAFTWMRAVLLVFMVVGFSALALFLRRR